jgi:diguanylate cyclase
VPVDTVQPRGDAEPRAWRPLDAAAIAARRSSFGLSSADEAGLDRIRFAVREDLAELVTAFYENLLGVPERQEFAPDPRKLDWLRQDQRHYMMTLGFESDTEEYVERRMGIGLAHLRAGVCCESYLAAHSRLFEGIARVLARRPDDDMTSTLVSLQRILAFDSHLFVEVYLRARQRWYEGRVDELSESHRLFIKHSRRDSVTQIDCRPFVLDALRAEFDRSRHAGQDFSLLFIDVDHFKAVNDSLGHAAGDDVLRRVVEIIQDSVRPLDIVGRYGGDEFLVGLVCADVGMAKLIADRLCDSVRAWPPGGGQVTVSIGICARTNEAALGDLIRRADAAMYAAKRNGRNRACEIVSDQEQGDTA